MVELLLIGGFLLKAKTFVDDYQDNADSPIGLIVKNQNIIQNITPSHDNVSAIELFFATYNRINTSHISIEIDYKGTKYFSKIVNASTIQDNNFLKVEFPPIKKSMGKNIAIKITSDDSSEGNGISIWASKEHSFSQGFLSINDIMQNKDLKFRTYYTTDNLERYIEGLKKIPLKSSVIIVVFICLLLFVNLYLFFLIFGLNKKRGRISY
jgi:hypothetical protein